MMRRTQAVAVGKRVGYNALVWGLVLVMAFPLFWMAITSIKPNTEIIAFPPTFLPSEVTLRHYQRLILETRFPRYFLNSVIVAVATTTLVIIVSTLGAYSLVRFRYAGRQVMGHMVLFTYLLPAVVLLVPLYVMVVTLKLDNSLVGLVMAYTTFAMPFALWLLRAFMAAQPVDLEEAARVDGASRMRAFVDVVLPQALPGIISTALFSFILSWNEYLYALVFIASGEKKTLPPGVISSLVAQYNIEWDLLMAASVTMIVPMVIFFSLLQRHLTRGFGAGGVKG